MLYRVTAVLMMTGCLTTPSIGSKNDADADTTVIDIGVDRATIDLSVQDTKDRDIAPDLSIDPRPSIITGADRKLFRLEGGTESASLATPLNPESTVPFISIADASEDSFHRVAVEADWNAGELKLERSSGIGPVEYDVTLLEFDPTFADVKQYEFDLSGKTHTVQLDGVIDRSQSFIVFYGRFIGDITPNDSARVTASFSSDQTILLSRTENRTSFVGQLWVVTAKGDAFSVEHLNDSFDVVSTTTTLNTLAVSPLVLWSYSTTSDRQSPAANSVACGFGNERIVCRRGSSNDGNGNAAIDRLAVQVVDWNQNIEQLTYSFNDPTQTQVVGNDVFAIHGSLGLGGASIVPTNATNPASFVGVSASNGLLTIRRNLNISSVVSGSVQLLKLNR